MRKVLSFGILLSLCAQAQISMPRPYSGGDYWVRNENTWYDWEVTAPELVGRLPADWPVDDEVAGALLHIDWAVQRWPVVARFQKGQRLRIKPDSVGGFLIKDLDGNSWMKVDLGDGKICFVRANARWVKPASPPIPAAVVTPAPSSTPDPVSTEEATSPTP